MTALVVALALGGTRGPLHEERQPAPLAASNAARARAGLLPRKSPARSPVSSRGGHRLVRALAAPTYLGEPGTLAELDDGAPAPDLVAEEEAGEGGALRLAAGGVTTDVTLSMRFEP